MEISNLSRIKQGLKLGFPKHLGESRAVPKPMVRCAVDWLSELCVALGAGGPWS